MSIAIRCFEYASWLLVSVFELSLYEYASIRRPNRRLFGVKHLSKLVGLSCVIGLLFSIRSIYGKIVKSSSIVNLAFQSWVLNCDFTNPINLSKNLPYHGAFMKFKYQSTPNFSAKPCVSSAVKVNLWLDAITSEQLLFNANLQKLLIIAPALWLFYNIQNNSSARSTRIQHHSRLIHSSVSIKIHIFYKC